MNSDDKIDLTSVNKTKKQFKLPKLKNPFKKNTAGPGRDEFGQFASGSGGLIKNSNFNWKRAAPLVVIVALVGGFFVFKSFAGTYHACSTASTGYMYSEECVTKSDEATVVRMYYATLNRAPDKSGLEYWTGKFVNKTTTVTKMADQFIASSEFKNKYGTLNNANFVNAMYPQVFERQADVSGAAYWTAKLDGKKITRAQMIANFVQSSEMIRSFSGRVASALDISPKSYTKELGKLPVQDINCLGTIKLDANKKWCSVSLPATDGKQTSYAYATANLLKSSLITKAGRYTICYETISSSPNPDSNNKYVWGRNDLANSATLTSSTKSMIGLEGYGLGSGFSCSSIDIVPALMNTSVFRASTEQSKPNTISFNMDSVKIYQPITNTSVKYVEQFDATRRTELQDVPGSGLVYNINGANVPTTKTVYKTVYVDASSPKPHWVHETDYIKGKNSVLFGYFSKGTSSAPNTVQLKVTDVKTGLPITTYKVVRVVDYYTYPRAYETIDSKQPTFTRSGLSDFTVELNIPKDTKVRIEANVVSSQGRFDGSYLDSGWEEE